MIGRHMQGMTIIFVITGVSDVCKLHLKREHIRYDGVLECLQGTCGRRYGR
jgi:hypothetical protein